MNAPAPGATNPGELPVDPPKPVNPEPSHQQKPKDPEKGHQPEPGQDGHSEHPKQ
ncbi:hypothetical protein [Ramlibacter henchirensis]|jgi:hypothetical protein|uniref:hypothetical protein n=1 Tax=Ramlibacter henchirensis TaxID=204072 RepID=UPI0014322416|nr:hypothetical protein [Ramlibacter henchirensis]